MPAGRASITRKSLGTLPASRSRTCIIRIAVMQRIASHGWVNNWRPMQSPKCSRNFGRISSRDLSNTRKQSAESALPSQQDDAPFRYCPHLSCPNPCELPGTAASHTSYNGLSRQAKLIRLDFFEPRKTVAGLSGGEGALNMDTTRRSFLAAAASAPFVLGATDKAGTKNPILGEGDHQY